MKRILLSALLLAALLGLSQCKKNDPNSVDQLPPATQTGAGTFGCLINGQPWTPQGNDGTSNFSVSYDITPTGGVLDVRTYRIYGKANDEFQNIVLFANQIAGTGTFSFRSPQRTRASFNDQKTNCYWSSRDSTTLYRRGTLVITRLDQGPASRSGIEHVRLYAL